MQMPVSKSESSMKLIVLATLGSALLMSDGAFSPATARIHYSDCQASRGRCITACIAGTINADNVGQALGTCLRQRCDANFAACVDFVNSQVKTGKFQQPPISTGTTPSTGPVLKSPGTFQQQQPIPKSPGTFQQQPILKSPGTFK